MKIPRKIQPRDLENLQSPQVTGLQTPGNEFVVVINQRLHIINREGRLRNERGELVRKWVTRCGLVIPDLYPVIVQTRISQRYPHCRGCSAHKPDFTLLIHQSAGAEETPKP